MVQQESSRKEVAGGNRKKQNRAPRFSLLRYRQFLCAARHCAADSPRSAPALVSSRWTGLLILFCLSLADFVCGQSSVTLAWTALTNSNVAGYRIYLGTASRAYSSASSVGGVSQAALSGLTSGTTYYFAMTAYNPAGFESDFSPEARYTAGSSNLPPPVITLLPLPWQSADIGNVSAAGGAGASGGSFTVAGAGMLSGTSDRFRFVYQPIIGDGEIRACISSLQNTGTNGCIGVMIREALTAGSRYAFMGVAPDWTWFSKRRKSTSGSTYSTRSGMASPSRAWVRVIRSGSTLTCFKSADGVNWTQVTSEKISMATSSYLGLAVASGNPAILNTSTFTNVVAVP